MVLDGHIEIIIITNDSQETLKLDTVIEVEINNDCTQLGATCDIVLPLNCRVKNDEQFLIDNPLKLFKKGDYIELKAWYTDYEKLTVFKGFIWDFTEANPIKMKCIDYVYNLIGGIASNDSKKAGLYYPKGKEYRFKSVIKDVLKDTGVGILEPFIDFDLTNMSLVNMSPKACLEHFKKELGLTMTLIDDKLYCNLAKFTLAEIKLQSDINVIKCELQKPDDVYSKIKVNWYKTNDKGKKEKVEIGDKTGELSEVFLYIVSNKKGTKTQTKLADNYLEEKKQGNYKGKLTTLLYPNINLFDEVKYTDVRFKDRSGYYVCRGYTLNLSTNGFKREMTLSFLRGIDEAKKEIEKIE